MGSIETFEKTLPKKAIILAYLLVLFIPPLGAMDVMNTQWLYVALVNLFSVGYILFNPSLFDLSFHNKLSKFVFIGTGLFVFVALLSFFKSMVVSESVVHLTMLLNTLIAFFVFYIIVKDYPKNYFNYIALLFVVFLGVESYQVVSYFIDYNSEPRTEELIRSLPHYYGNRNILATSLVIKLVFTIYYFIQTEKKIRYIYLAVFGVAMVAILLIGSRTAIYSLPILISIISFGYFKFLRPEIKTNVKNYHFGIPVIVVLVSSLYLSLSVNKIYPGQLNSFSDLVFTKSKVVIENEKKQNKKAEYELPLKKKDFHQAGVVSVDFEAVDQKSKKKKKRTSLEVDYFNDSGRLLYWFSGIETFKRNLLLGSGLGQWKLIDKLELVRKKSGNGYFYPRRVHNDFLQIIYETGIIGFLLFGGFFIVILIAEFKGVVKSDEKRNQFKNLILLCAFLAFSIDSIINFPAERPSIQLQAFALISLILAFVKKDSILNFSRWGLVALIVTSCGLIYTNYQMFTSSKVDMKVRDWDKGLNIFKDKYPMSYNELVSKYDNFIELDGFGKPKDIVKAKFAYTEGRFQTAMNHLNRAIQTTPYQLEHMALKAVIFELNDKFKDSDSALTYSKKVYYTNPDLSNMYNITKLNLERKKDSAGLEQFFIFTNKARPLSWKAWKEKIELQLNFRKDTILSLNSIDSVLNIYPNDQYFKNFRKKLTK